MKVVVGISGGVDSSVAAYLLKEQGHEVIGITMRLMDGDDVEGLIDAEKVCKHLGIEHFELDLRDTFRKKIIGYIQEDYSAGRTPNPCVLCNREIKFGLFLENAKKIVGSFDLFGTGHYANVEEVDGRMALKQGEFAEKDQAYFLSMLKQDQLKKVIFPLGNMKKSEVREIAKKIGLFTAEKKESQDICLGDYRTLIDIKSSEGDFITSDGRILGKHKGIEHYTIGQRKGLGIGAGYPLYVISINKNKNQVVVGSNDELYSKKVLLRDINWGFIKDPKLPYDCLGKIRYRDSGYPCKIQKKEDGSLIAEFEEARRAVTPGQLAVFYDLNGFVSFSGFIESALN